MYAEDIAHGSSGVAFGTDGAKDSSFEHVGVIRERVGTYPSDAHAAAIHQRVGSQMSSAKYIGTRKLQYPGVGAI